MLKQREQVKNYFRIKPVDAGVIDVRDLPKEDIRFVENFVELLRKKDHLEYKQEPKNKKIKFAEWNLAVKGKIGRDEIYDHL